MYDEKADIWSLGMVAYQIFTNNEPNGLETPQKFAHKVSTENYRPSLEEITNSDWTYFIQRCWETDPCKRPTASELLDIMHDFGMCNSLVKGTLALHASDHSDYSYEEEVQVNQNYDNDSSDDDNPHS